MNRTVRKASRLGTLVCTAAMALSSMGPAKADLSEAYAQVFVNNDINGSGQMSRAEFAHFEDLLFLQIDLNEDDFLTVDEWANWEPNLAGVEYQPAEIGKVYAVMARLFVTMDQDADGRLTRVELIVGLFREFGEADTHNDGLLTVDEFGNAYLLPKIVADDFHEMFGDVTAPAMVNVPPLSN